MAVLDSESDPELDARHIRMLDHRRADGALIAMADETNPRTLAALRGAPAGPVSSDRSGPYRRIHRLQRGTR